MRTLFFGTPEIATPALRALHEMSEVAAVVCQPDRPAGRGLSLRPPPVKSLALELGLEIHQPKRIKTAAFAAWVRQRHAEVAVVLAYGRILPKSVLGGPRRGCVNLHASILPRYRGAAPINWAIVRGEKETGISLMQMDEGCDTGPVFCIRAIPIGEDESAGELAPRLAELAADVVREELPAVVSGRLTPTPQDHAAATHAPLLSRADGSVDFRQSAQAVHDHVRGMTPWPGAHSLLGDRRFKILETRLEAEVKADTAAGQILAIDDRGARVVCGDGCIRILRGQLPGKKPLSASQLAQGRQLTVGMVFAA